MILALLVFGFVGCQKDEVVKPELNEIHLENIGYSDHDVYNYVSSDKEYKLFFNLSKSLTENEDKIKLEQREFDSVLEDIKLEIARQDIKWKFVKEHISNYGYPDWNNPNKYKINDFGQNLYFIPLVKNSKIEAIIAAIKNSNNYHFDIIDRKTIDNLIKEKIEIANQRKNLLPFVGEFLSLGDKLHKEKNKNYYKWYIDEIARLKGLNFLESRSCVSITVCQWVYCDPYYGSCPFLQGELETRSYQYNCTSYDQCQTNEPTSCTLCGGGGTGGTGSSGGTNNGGTGSTTPTTICYNGYGDPVSCFETFNRGAWDENISNSEIFNGIELNQSTSLFQNFPPREIASTLPRGNSQDSQSGYSGNTAFIAPPSLLQKSNDELFVKMNSLFDFFTSGNYKAIGQDFVSRFKTSQGGTYEHSGLNSLLANTTTIKNTIKIFGDLLKSKLAASNGVLNSSLQFTVPQLNRPIFNSKELVFTGPKILINDTEQTKYFLEGFYSISSTREFWAKGYIEVYDHFGVDQNDTETYQSFDPGFAAWYLLQHTRNYKPFTTKIKIPFSFKGKY